MSSVAGNRSVPIEIGSSYLSDDYSQKLMPLETFIANFIFDKVDTVDTADAEDDVRRDVRDPSGHTKSDLDNADVNNNNNDDSDDNNDGNDDNNVNNDQEKQAKKKKQEKQERSKSIGYLAQYRLFDHIPKLREDIVTPDYCALLTSEDEEELYTTIGEEKGYKTIENTSTSIMQGGGNILPTHLGGDNVTGTSTAFLYNSEPNNSMNVEHAPDDIILNAWLGPSHTISPLHHDPYHNLLAQVVGYKYVRLYHPDMSGCLYPMEGRMCNNRYHSRL